LVSLQDITTADPRAKAQLDLLSHLIGSRDSAQGTQMEFRLNLFSDNADDDDDDSAGCVLRVLVLFLALFTLCVPHIP